MQLNLSNIEYTYPLAVEPTIRNVTATLPAGWTGFVGDNGSGKTTLARVVCGFLQPDVGVVSPSLFSTYCAQSTEEPPGNLEDFAVAYDRAAIKLRNELSIEDEWPWRYNTLSCGQQKRLQVACALWSAPDVLVVDEPTNHVDASTRHALFTALSKFKGIGVLISHDRVLLDALCSQCLFIANGTATMRPGGYSQAFSQVALERSSAIHAREIAQKEKVRTEREAQRRREEASRVQARRSGKGITKNDSDARAKRRHYIISGQDGKAGKLSARMQSRLGKAEDDVADSKVEKRYDAHVWLNAEPSKREVLFRMGPGRIAVGESLLSLPALFIGNTDHIGLVGDNGSGKTTLVKKIIASISADTSLINTSLMDATSANTGCADTKVLYIPQEPDMLQKEKTLKKMRELSSAQRGQVLSIVAQLNSDPDCILEGDTVSPGEMRKLMLALGILESPELLVMDEPTNYLDLGSTEALERLLSVYPGALLLVSHDASLVSSATSITWRIQKSEDGYKLVVN
ncbi:ABC transporter, ATP-binding protein [Lancefieldella rimae]|uniref:ABC transporter, ATP-binding protein n=2 Tax=Lancefieldella rimae TaxID=1383 RepID=B9CN80_LANR4|nr:ATP-binding cassette domain-containing protein [Lancefieldella rimae]EEE17096.1 ABC transporter, ATP-binding protein [Lancefieldella rimae ATCC 49626]KRO01573.1 ABC transporter, ATP-binding protein [Lancefieldella rimae]